MFFITTRYLRYDFYSSHLSVSERVWEMFLKSTSGYCSILLCKSKFVQICPPGIMLDSSLVENLFYLLD